MKVREGETAKKELKENPLNSRKGFGKKDENLQFPILTWGKQKTTFIISKWMKISSKKTGGG